MTLNDIEDKLKQLAPSVEVPKELASRLISAVSEHALKKQRRRLIWQYLGHGFTSVIVAFFGIKWVAPGIENKNLAIAGAIILAMFWLLFKVSGVRQRQHFGRIAFSAATFGFVVATTGLFTLSGEPQTIESLDLNSSLPSGSHEIIEQASDSSLDLPNVVSPMDENTEIDDLEGSGIFGKVVSVNEMKEFVNITSLLDSGEKLTIPVPLQLYYKGELKNLEIGDRVYIENQFIYPIDEESVKPKPSQTPFMES